MPDIKIKDEFIKLGDLLKFAGITGTGGEAKAMILEGRIFVNGEKEERRGRKVYRGDVVTYSEGRINVR